MLDRKKAQLRTHSRGAPAEVGLRVAHKGVREALRVLERRVRVARRMQADPRRSGSHHASWSARRRRASACCCLRRAAFVSGGWAGASSGRPVHHRRRDAPRPRRRRPDLLSAEELGHCRKVVFFYCARHQPPEQASRRCFIGERQEKSAPDCSSFPSLRHVLVVVGPAADPPRRAHGQQRAKRWSAFVPARRRMARRREAVDPHIGPDQQPRLRFFRRAL